MTSGDKSSANSNDNNTNSIDLYSLLNVHSDATVDDIHRAYKRLSTTFHPDKLPRDTPEATKDKIQQVFLEFKLANDILTDPVLRLAYDSYGDEAVTLIKRIQQHEREQRNRKAAAAAAAAEAAANSESAEFDDDDQYDDDEDDNETSNLYERLERLLETNPIQAKEELQQFMEQYSYQQELVKDHQVQLSCTLDFPPVVEMKTLVFEAKDYLQMVERRIMRIAKNRSSSQDEIDMFKHRVMAERRLVDYQLNQFKEGQKAEVGISLTSIPQHHTNMSAATGDGSTTNSLQPKWNMTMGGSTNVIYPGIAELMKLVSKKDKNSSNQNHHQHHPASTFVTLLYQPVPDTQVYMTANLSNDSSHQFVLGSSRRFASRTSFRYNLTFIPNAPMASPIVVNFVTARHIKNVGTASWGISVLGGGSLAQANVKLESVRGEAQNHKYSAKASLAGRDGPALTLGYKCRFQKNPWLEQYITLPKKFDLSTTWSAFSKISAMVTHEFSSLATSPTLGFGMEHEIALGCWTWIWQWSYQHSTFRVPIPVLHLGSIVDPSAYYLPKLYHAIYCLLVQSMVADILADVEEQQQARQEGEVAIESGLKASGGAIKATNKMSVEKSRVDGERQVALMKQVAERKRIYEEGRDGLVILRAVYWIESFEIGLRPQTKILSMDAVIQLQFWIIDSKLSLPSTPKGYWLGFYNLRTEARTLESNKPWDWRFWRRWTRRASLNPQHGPSQPQLTIRYSYQGYVYEITVGEAEAVELPTKDAQLLGPASTVQ